MSLHTIASDHTIVSDVLLGRLHRRPVDAAPVAKATTEGIVRLSGASMRLLETGLAVTALVTALLIGLGR